MTTQSDRSIFGRHLSIVYFAFIAASVISFMYCLFTHQFNGDFFPRPVFLSPWLLSIVLVLCLLPYAVSWQIAQAFERTRPKKTFQASYRALTIFLLLASLAHIAVTVLFGVGVMDREVYTAPAVAVPFIQIINRLDPFYLGVFYILATPKRPASDLLALALMITLGLLRAGLGVFNYAIIALVAKYSIELMIVVRRAPWLSFLILSVMPPIIGALYQLREHLRGDVQIDLNLVDMLFGRFFGRLSAFSNIAYIMQNAQSFIWSARSLESFYYLKQGASGVFGVTPPTITPERLLIAGNQYYGGYSSYMAGVSGNLILAWNVSPFVCLINLLAILVSVVGILWISRFFGGGVTRLFGLAMLVYPLTSGVANEFALLLLNCLVLLGFVMLFQTRPQLQGAAHG